MSVLIHGLGFPFGNEMPVEIHRREVNLGSDVKLALMSRK